MTRMALLTLAISPKTSADARRLAIGLAELRAQDSALHVRSGQLADDVVVGGVTDQHLEIVLDRLKREFHVEASVGRPQIAYREALKKPAQANVKYATRSAGRGEYAHVKIRVSPGERDSGFIFENRMTGGALPDRFIKAAEQGIQERLAAGVLAGHPIQDVRVDLCDASFHDNDSSDAAFRLAGSLAAEEAARKGEPVVLEPMMRVEVIVPVQFLDDVMKNLVSRRGRIKSVEDDGKGHVIRAIVPLVEMLGYSVDLHARTFGRGSHTIQFEQYEPIHRTDTDAGLDALVRAPIEPAPKGRDSRLALPEPEEDQAEQ